MAVRKRRVKVFSVRLPSYGFGDKEAPDEKAENLRKSNIAKLEKDVNEFLDKHPEANVEWIQTSASGAYPEHCFTQLTAIMDLSIHGPAS